MDDYLTFLKEAPTPWHAVATIEKRLAGFTKLDEGDEWSVEPGKGYFFIRGGSLIAFRMPKNKIEKGTIFASHTDSPSLRLKPHPVYRENNMNLYRVGIFGGPLLSTWFDRDLSVAGIILKDQGGEIATELYHDKSPITIPSLAIHLQNEKERKAFEINKQKHIGPIFSLTDDEVKPFADALAFDLFLVPLEEPRMLSSSLIAAYRHDNLSSVYASLEALLKASPSDNSLQVCAFYNHEEVGSASDEGAMSPLLNDLISRLGAKRLKSRFLCVSIDVTHAYHPNFADKHDPQHKSFLGNGPAIKYNANLRSVTTAKTAAPIVKICRKFDIPFQENTDINTLRTGSTVGPYLSSHGFPTVDLGMPLLAMHSIRELIHGDDLKHLTNLLEKCLAYS
jgi:aspartyl aminopeptidase